MTLIGRIKFDVVTFNKSHSLINRNLLLLFFILICIRITIYTKYKTKKVFFNGNKNRTLKFENISCKKLFYESASPSEISNAENWQRPFHEQPDDYTIYQTECSMVLDSFEILNISHHKEEEDFPIAFSVIAYKHSTQIIQLLRMIYRPWNFYCIHVDLKSVGVVFESINHVVQCLNQQYHNIINAQRNIEVEWSRFSVLEADLICMDELYRNFKSWKYFINLTGQEFPLKTNLELVRILKAYRGANNVDGSFKFRNMERIPKMHLSFPMEWLKGAVHVTVNRYFVNYSLHHPHAKEMLQALKLSRFSDEQFFSSLNFNPQSIHIQGGFPHNPDYDYTFLTRYKRWNSLKFPCRSGTHVRQVCILGIRDLPALVQVPYLFANKFHWHFQPATLKCLEQRYLALVKQQSRSNCLVLDEEYYSSQQFVLHQSTLS